MSEKNEDLNISEEEVLKDPKKVITKSDSNINNNLGTFGETKFGYEEVKEVEEIVEEEKRNVKINFEKFSKDKVYADNFFGKFKNQFEKKLSNNKSFLLIWLGYLLLTIIFAGSGALFIYYDHHFLHATNTINNGNFFTLVICGKAGEIISYIFAIMPIVPLFVLLITWMVGINNVARGLSFHLFYVFFFAIVFVVFLIAMILSSIYLGNCNNYWSILP